MLLNIVTDVPVAVVDNSHSELSRNFIRWLDATPASGDLCSGYGLSRSEGMDEKLGKYKVFCISRMILRNGYFRGDEAVFSLYATDRCFPVF